MVGEREGGKEGRREVKEECDRISQLNQGLTCVQTGRQGVHTGGAQE